jgi:Skp family chaperone for outer membrane proteins
MNRRNLFILAGIFLIPSFFLAAPVVGAAEPLNVGFVDLSRIRKEYRDYQTAVQSIQSIREEEQKDLDEMSGDFDAKVRRYEIKDGLHENEDEKNKELEALRRDWDLLTEHKMQKDRELELKSQETLAPFIDRIRDAITTVSKNNGKHLIFKKQDLAYSDERLDITDLVLRALNGE